MKEEIKNHTKLKGLTDAEVTANRASFGTNTLTPPKRTSLWRLYLEKFQDPIIRILLVAACFSFVLAFFENDFAETIGIFLAIFFATGVGFYFECDAAKKFNVLNALDEESLIKVIRNGNVHQIPRHDIVVGDVVLLEVGDEVPADGILSEAKGLQIDESTLTGEPLVDKSIKESQQDKEATYPTNHVLRSTMVMNGSGVMTVSAVGDATEIGKVAQKSTEKTEIKTPLNIQLSKLAKLISYVGFTVAIATFVIFSVHEVIQFSHTNPAWDTKDILNLVNIILYYFMMSVTLIVMAVPEGLPMAITLSLALNMRRMLKSNNLVRKLHACETMGAVTVICTDKTGTLTQNRMQVAEVNVDVANEDFANAIALNTTAFLDEEIGNKGIGNPTEVALLLWLKNRGVDYRALREKNLMIDQLPFSTERKYMATIAEISGKRWLFVKGAPEIVMGFCGSLPDEKRKSVEIRLLGYQQKAMRTLGFASQQLDESASDCNIAMKSVDLTWQGVTAIVDPLREEVPDAVRRCCEAGIKVKIVTGDTSATAVEIARQIGIWNKDADADWLITGAEFTALSDEDAMKRAINLRVMSRARPADKQRLVELLQRQDAVVAVTGDGTNDAPALNYAQVGLSLGSGTSVAKEASDITLIDDSFNSIVKAVMWGRSLYKNIQRFLFFQLVVNVTALLLVLVGSVIGTDLPLTVTQILWVNLIMDTFAAMALASLPPSREALKEKPRRSSDFIITNGMLRGIALVGIAFFTVLIVQLLYYRDVGISLHELTIFFTTFVMLQFWNLFNAKTLGSDHSAFHHFWRDNGLILVLVMIFVGQWLIVEFGGRMFRTEPLSFSEWIEITVSTSLVMWIGEIWRGIKRLRWEKK